MEWFLGAKMLGDLALWAAGATAAGGGLYYLGSRERSEHVHDISSVSDNISDARGQRTMISSAGDRKEKKKSKDEKKQASSDEDESSEEEEEEEEEEDYLSTRYNSVSVSSHIRDRLLRFVRFAGILQRISEEADINRSFVARCNASEYQDRSSGRPGYHAAHVVRVSDIDSTLRNRGRYRRYYNELRNFGGHTQIVKRYANIWRGLGGDIDRLQSRFLDTLNIVDFSTSLNSEAKKILQHVRDCLIDILDKYIYGSKLTWEEKQELKRAKKKILEISISDLFKKGRDGYNGKHTDNYE